MNSSTYNLTLPVFTLHDQEEDNYAWSKHRISSGDYFITLATRLDMISQELPENSYAALLMSEIVRNLEYLQENFDIVEKDKDNK